MLKLVSDEQSLHATLALVAVGNGVLNEVSPLDHHALLKFTFAASVPSFASLGNDVSDAQFCHVDRKLVQFLMSVVLKLVSEEQFCHVVLTVVTEGSCVLKLSSEEQLIHAPLALVTEGSGVLKLVSELLLHA